MDEARFWDVVVKACRSDPRRAHEWHQRLQAELSSLADAVAPGIDAEAEIYAAAHQAWMAVTGSPDTDPYPARNERAELRGQDWDFNDADEVRRRLPRLAAMYLE
jgi:hypothetical protein